ncbi:TolC family protein [Myroides indicus]|uniref:Outer membrane protein n=1 Tax=Myroides indicus TaxID=1323422 RepID=A0A4R7EQ38_9FLAO|nr:TolC family protein [Myroides indicus]TDS54614.1 outer membrane protein [Myroides indicus]
MNKLIFLLIFTLISSTVFAQQSWTLKNCVEKGEVNSYPLKVAALETKVAEKRKQSLTSLYLPDVTLNGIHSYNFGSTIDPSTNSRVASNILSDQFSIDASMDLFNLQNLYILQRQKLDTELAQMSEEEVAYNYQTELLIQFYEVLTTQEWLIIQRQQMINSSNNLSRIFKEVDAGAKPQSDLYDIDYLFKRDEINIKETENLLYNQKLKLLHWLNETELTPSDFNLVLTEEFEEGETDYLYNPTVEKFKINQRILQKERQLLKAEKAPRLQANYSFGSFYSKLVNSDNLISAPSFSDQLHDNKSHYVGFRLSIPVFQGGSVIRKLCKNQMEQQLSELKIEESKSQLNNQNKEIETEIKQLGLMADKLISSIDLAQKSFATTQVKYENGKADVFSFNQAKNELLNSQFALIKNNLTRSLLQKRLKLNNTNAL